jgi:hypothetical protein
MTVGLICVNVLAQRTWPTSKLLRLNNTSGARGVSWNKRLGKWHARVNYQRRLFHCGYFDTFEEARTARDAKALQLHGAFAQLNNLQEYVQ